VPLPPARAPSVTPDRGSRRAMAAAIHERRFALVHSEVEWFVRLALRPNFYATRTSGWRSATQTLKHGLQPEPLAVPRIGPR
jgi:hypothetical protein